MKEGTLVLVRHAESRMNLVNKFTGWLDVPLSEKGVLEAQRCAKHCLQFSYNTAFTSNLERARETLLIILSKQKKIGIFHHQDNSRYHNLKGATSEFRKELIPIFTSENLNERAYGNLQGMNKNSAKRLFGSDILFKWRRSFKSKPPGGESLKDVYDRVIPFFQKNIKPKVTKGETVLVAAHGNTLRSLIKYIESINDEQISFIDLPNARPLVYKYKNKEFVRIEGEYKFNRPLR